MLLTILLAKIIGLYMLIGGVAVLLRRRFIMAALASIVEEKGVRLILSVFDIFLGLVIVNLHPDWSTLPAALITLIGWAAIVKGLAGVFMKDASLDKMVKAFRDKNLYVLDGAVAIVLGLYLAGFGFNWF